MRSRFIRLLAIVSVLISSQTAWAVVPRPSEVTLSFSLADLGEKDFTIRAIYDQTVVRFSLPEGAQIQHATLHLNLSHDRRLLPELSDVTLALNDEPVARLALTSDNAKQTTVDVPIPITSLRPGENLLIFRFHLRLRETGCADRDDPNLWVKIFSDTTLELGAVEAPLVPDLARFPAPFVTLSTLGGPQVLLVLPARPNAAELTAAAQIAAALGQSAQWSNPPLSSVTFDQLTEEQAAANHLIVIDSGGRNPLAQTAPTGLTELVSPYNPVRLMLVVTGADAAGLARSAALLATQSARSLLQGTHVDPVAVTAQPMPARPTLATFSELGYITPRLRGLGVHDLYYPVDVPYDWKLTDDAGVDVSFIHASGLSSVNSWLRVFVNSFPVTAVALNKRNDSDGRLTIQLSPRQMHPGRNWLHLAFDLHMPSEDCRFRYREEAWAAVLPVSAINLAHVTSAPPLDLRLMPSAFVLPADLSGNVFVLAEQPTPAELTALVAVAAKLGTFVNADGLRPEAFTAAAQVPDGLNAILIGQPATHALLAQYDVQLPQPLSWSDGQILPAGGRELLLGEADNQAGYLELLPAPDGTGGIWLVLSGRASESLASVVAAMPTLGKRLPSSGNVAVVLDDRVNGFTLGQLAGAPLSAAGRGALAVILFSTTVFIIGAGIFTARRRQSVRESKDAIE